MDQPNTQKMLEIYIIDYLRRKNLHYTAQLFAQEGNICDIDKPSLIDPSTKNLENWWKITYDVSKTGWTYDNVETGVVDQEDIQKMLDMHIHDYMKRNNFKLSADTFARESNICYDSTQIDSSNGYVEEWWSISYEVWKSECQDDLVESGESSSHAQTMAPRLPSVCPTIIRRGVIQIGDNIVDISKWMKSTPTPLLPQNQQEQEQPGQSSNNPVPYFGGLEQIFYPPPPQ